MSDSEEAAWVTYVLCSEAEALTYVGITNELERRLAQHNGELAGGARSTQRGRPWKVGAVYGPFSSRGEAQRVEARVKKLRGRRRLSWAVEEPEA